LGDNPHGAAPVPIFGDKRKGIYLIGTVHEPPAIRPHQGNIQLFAKGFKGGFFGTAFFGTDLAVT
jgi:hypothetical protein